MRTVALTHGSQIRLGWTRIDWMSWDRKSRGRASLAGDVDRRRIVEESPDGLRPRDQASKFVEDAKMRSCNALVCSFRISSRSAVRRMFCFADPILGRG